MSENGDFIYLRPYQLFIECEIAQTLYLHLEKLWFSCCNSCTFFLADVFNSFSPRATYFSVVCCFSLEKLETFRQLFKLLFYLLIVDAYACGFRLALSTALARLNSSDFNVPTEITNFTNLPDIETNKHVKTTFFYFVHSSCLPAQQLVFRELVY